MDGNHPRQWVSSGWKSTPILNYEESLLIFNHVAASVRFIKALEAKIKIQVLAAKAESAWDDDVRF